MALDEGGEEAAPLGPDAGLVAATSRYGGLPVWVVTGGTAAAVRAAAESLDAEHLRDHYAVAIKDDKTTPLPLESAVKSPFAYQPRPRPLQLASPGAAVAYLGAIVAVAFLYSNPLVLFAAGDRRRTGGTAGRRSARRAGRAEDGLRAGAADRRRQRPGRQPR